jgi:tetratricopeptide (TPR) repeat protein
MPYDSVDAKEQFLKECRAVYQGNSAQLAKVCEFEQTYRACDAIYWYTKPCFVIHIISRALRSGDALILYKLRYFIVDMCKNLEATATTQSSVAIHVYRGAPLAKEEVEKLNVGSLVAANGFFSSSSNLQVAQSFIMIDESTAMSPSRSRNDQRQFVLFEIEIDPTTIRSADVTVANVSSQSAIPEEDEVIFGLGTTFVVTEILYDVKHYLWNIKMAVSSETAGIKREQRAFIRKSLAVMTATCLFGTRLADIWGHYTQASAYFHNLLRTLSADHIDRPLLYYHIGRVYRFLGKHQRAIAYLRCAELLQRRLLPQTTYDYGSTLAALGATYSEVGDSRRAVRLHERAIAAHSSCLPRYDREMAFHANRLAYACFQEKQYERALSVLADIEIVFKSGMPAGHPSLAQMVHTRALVYHAMDNSERALDCFKEALSMRELWLTNDHPAVARTCYQLALLHEERSEYKQAFEHAQRALSIQQNKLPETHQERKWSQESVERLRRHTIS